MQSLQGTAETPQAAPPPDRAPRGRMGRPAQWRLATRLTLAVVAFAIPLELIVLWSGLSSLEERRAAELDNAVLIGQALAAVVDGFAGDLQSTTFSTAILLGAQPGPLTQETAGEHLRVIAEQYSTLRAMFLTDTQGRLIATGTGGELGFDLSSRPYMPPLMAGAPAVWSGGISGVQTGETTVAFGRAVHGPDGATRAFLLAAFYPQQFVQRLPISLPPNARVTVLDDRGVALYDSSPGDRPVGLADSASVRAVLGGQIVRIVGQSDLGNDDARFGALVPISRLSWAVGYTLPHEVVEAALARRTWAQAGGIALVILVAAGVVVAIARRLTRPLTMLAETADAIARGEQPSVPEIESATEVRRLALAMRVMSAAVADREDALRAQRELLRVTLASIGDAVVATDDEGRVTFANAAAAALVGRPEQEATGQDVQSLLRLRNEQTGTPVDSPIARVLREGVVVGLANHTILVRPDGTEVPIDDSAAPIRDDAGALIGVVMVFRDVTERRRVEERLRESESRLRLAVEAAPVVLFNHDRELRYTWVGKAFAGFEPETLLGRTDAELFPPEIAEPAMALKRRALATGERAEGEIDLPADLRSEDGATRRWELTAEPLRDGDGAVVGITCAALDVTERRALERMQQEFISLVSHELRNPLASVKGYAQLMQRRGEFHERAVRSIVEQSDHLDRLISDLLDSSRAEAGRLELRRKRANLVDVVSGSVERIQAQTQRHRIRLASSDDQLLGVWDTQRLDQVFTNLLSNAVKYAPDGGEIVVRVERQDHEAHVAVRDQGVGIPPDQLPRIFDRFYRVTATAPSIQGLGIGLYIAKELVEAHGGRMWAESPGPGQGATLHLTLALDAQPSPERTASRPVLVVEDDQSLRELIADTLRDEGYHLAVARDGLEALDRVAADPPALILLDWMMPRLGGEGFATELRRRHPTLDVPIVVMTAGGVAHERAASIGADGFINKPFELAVLLDQVARHLGPRASDVAPTS